MCATQTEVTIREAVGVFTDAPLFQHAIDDLLGAGFDRADLSLLAAEDTVDRAIGRHYRSVAELEDDRQVPRGTYVSAEAIGGAEGGLIGGLLYVGAVAAATPIVAAGGPLAVAVVAAAMGGGAGSVLGGVLAMLVGVHHAAHLQRQLDQGGLLLWVRTWTPAQESRALEILARHGGRDVHVHSIPGLPVQADPQDAAGPAPAS